MWIPQILPVRRQTSPGRDAGRPRDSCAPPLPTTAQRGQRQPVRPTRCRLSTLHLYAHNLLVRTKTFSFTAQQVQSPAAERDVSNTQRDSLYTHLHGAASVKRSGSCMNHFEVNYQHGANCNCKSGLHTSLGVVSASLDDTDKADQCLTELQRVWRDG